MYVRPPSGGRERISVPENYSGYAFREKSILEDMPPPKHIDQTVYRHNDNSDYPSDHETVKNTIENQHLKKQEPKEIEQESTDTPFISEQGSPRPAFSVLSSLLPSSSNNSKHFPFGHGIGSEEILILAIMLLVFMSGARDGKSDDELLLLLGFLLLSG